jgi:phospholipid-binding lipoprotein MlaA
MIGVPINMVSVVNTRANADGSLKFINEAALDPYVFTRESFMQWRNNLATDGKTDSANNNIDELDIESLDDEKTSALKEDGAVAKKSNESNSGISLEPETK